MTASARNTPLSATENASINRKNYNIYGSFFLGHIELAVSIQYVQEVVNFPQTMSSMPLAPDYLVGIFNLRGRVIPVVNLKILMNLEDNKGSRNQKIAILDYKGVNIGFAFDATGEILRSKPEELSEFEYQNGANNKVVGGVLKLNNGDRLLQVLDPEALIAIQNLPQLTEHSRLSREENLRRKAQNQKKKCICFTVGVTKLAIEITGIHEIITIPEIQYSSMQSEICLGIINLRGRIAPALNLLKILKIREEKSAEESAPDNKFTDGRIIVLKIDTEYFGFLVNSVDSINSYDLEAIMPIPLLSNERMKVFLGCINFDNMGDVILLNQQELLNDKEVLDITKNHASLYQSNQLIEEKNQQNKSKGREVFILFHIKTSFGLPINEIQEIIDYPKGLLEAPGLPAFVKGMLNIRGKLYIVVDTRILFKMPPIDHPLPSSEGANECKILTFNRNGECFGLIIDSIDSILTVHNQDRIALPSLLQVEASNYFQNEIKEALYINGPDGKDMTLIILNIEAVLKRIKTNINLPKSC